MFMGFLRADTAATKLIGPFVDATDGYSQETGLVITKNTTMFLSKGGGSLSSFNTTAAISHEIYGFYALPFEVEDVDTEGLLQVIVGNQTNATRPLVFTWQVLPASVYDMLLTSSSTIAADVASILEDTGTSLPNLFGSLSPRGVASLEDVPDNRTVVFIPTSGLALVNALNPLELALGIPGTADDESVLCAVDFSRDLRPGQQVSDVLNIEQLSGTTDGVTLTAVGVDHAKAKLTATPVTAGDYEYAVKVAYTGSGGRRTAKLSIRVVQY